MNQVFFGDCRGTMRRLASEGVRAKMCVTSPPYFGLRDYGHDGQLGLEQTPDAYIAVMVEVFRCVRDVLSDDGTLWLNIGDSYASFKDGKAVPDTARGDSTGTAVPKGLARNRMASSFEATGIKNKDLIGIPWMLAFALRADGWYLRQDIVWHKPNPMPESVKDRCTKSHEYLFLLSKSPTYHFRDDNIQEPAVSGETRKRRSVWSIPTRPYKGAHFAVFPSALVEPCILAGSGEGDIILDPFLGSGTTAAVAVSLGRQYIGCEINERYAPLSRERVENAWLERLTRGGS